VGYAGGTTSFPTYQSLGDHTETIQIEYDPTRITYENLLDLFWKSHEPSSKAWSRQYMAAVFYHDDVQKELALASKNREASGIAKKIHTEILPFTGFTLAENYHQKYRLQREKDLMREFAKIYPSFDNFNNSTATARVNGYLGGFGTVDRLKVDLDRLGLSPQGGLQLLRIVEYRNN
jgi:methionine-S-sulfoxide reductase